jgi:hypothetical protein
MPHTFTRYIPMLLMKSIIAIAVAMFTLSPLAQAKDSEAKNPLEMMHHSYRHLIAGNVADLPRNKQAVAFFAKKAKETDNPDHRKKYGELSKLYEEIAGINQAVVDGFKSGRIPPAKEALAKLPALEAKVEAITGKPTSRAWLTFAEVNVYYKRLGTEFKTEAEGVFPFHRKHWDQNAIRRMKEEKKNSE